MPMMSLCKCLTTNVGGNAKWSYKRHVVLYTHNYGLLWFVYILFLEMISQHLLSNAIR